MALLVTPLAGHMAGAIEGLDLGRTLDETTRAELRRAILDKQVLCIRGQTMGPEHYLDAMRSFGEPLIRRQVTQHEAVPEINILSPEEKDRLGDGRRLVNGAHWHTDDSFMAVPGSLTMLYGIVVPPSGGDTQFVNMYAAYDDLPEAVKQRLAPLRVVHMYKSSRNVNPVATLSPEAQAKMPPVSHPLVRTHPETGRKALYLNPNRMDHIDGMTRDESDALLDELIAHATQPKYEYRHKWRQGDVVIWDNRCLMHKANPDYDGNRVMHRIIIAGTAPA